MANGLTLITPTSDRPQAFALCERWMSRQTYKGPLQWIVVDDGRRSVNPTLGQEHVCRRPSRTPTESFRANLLHGLQRTRHEKVLFIEDDDWYAPAYLERMDEWLSGDAEIVGEARAKYYNVQTRRYLQCANRAQASLCQTGIRRPLVNWIMQHLRRSRSAFTDVHLWKYGVHRSPKLLWPNSLHSVGIKGLPGKNGIGVGHRLGEQCPRDGSGRVLRSWIGDDADVYLDMCPHSELVGMV